METSELYKLQHAGFTIVRFYRDESYFRKEVWKNGEWTVDEFMYDDADREMDSCRYDSKVIVVKYPYIS